MTNPPSAHLEQQAREVLAAHVSRSWREGIISGQNNNWGHIRPSEAIAAMLAFRDAPKPAPEHHELREKVAQIIDPHADYIATQNGKPARWNNALVKADAILALIPNPSPDISELVDGIDPTTT